MIFSKILTNNTIIILTIKLFAYKNKDKLINHNNNVSTLAINNNK